MEDAEEVGREIIPGPAFANRAIEVACSGITRMKFYYRT